MQYRMISALLALLLLAGCATEQQQRGATTGALLGAAAGAMIGSDSDNAVGGAVVGGVIGGLAGAVIAGDNNQVSASEPRYRRGCARGERYFDDARRERDPHRRVDDLREGLRYCPNNPAALNDLGVALIIIGRDDEARGYFDRALRIDPDYLPARRNIGHLDRGMHDRGRHEGDYRRNERGRDRGYDRRERRDDRRDYRRDDRYDD